MFKHLQRNGLKGDFVVASALASNNLSVFSPQGPTEGCGVIPVEGRCMCIDPDRGGYHAAGLRLTLQSGLTFFGLTVFA